MTAALPLECPWSELAGPFLFLLAQMDVETTLLPLWGTISMTVDSLQSGAFAGRRALTNKSSPMSGCGQGHEPPENTSMKLWLMFPVLAPSRNGNMDHGRYP